MAMAAMEPPNRHGLAFAKADYGFTGSGASGAPVVCVFFRSIQGPEDGNCPWLFGAKEDLVIGKSLVEEAVFQGDCLQITH